MRLVRSDDVALRRPHIRDGKRKRGSASRCADGTVHNRHEDRHDPQGIAVLEKFRLNAEHILGKDLRAAAIDLVQRLETLTDVGQLLSCGDPYRP